MQPIFFSALLKSGDGQLLETGTASMSADGSIIFKNEFVPLMRMGTPIQVVRLLGEEEVQTFEGQVYLSSKSLLKMTTADPQAVRAALRLFEVNASATAKLTLKDSHEPAYRAGDIIDGSVYYLSPQCIKLLSMEQIEVGHQLMLELESPLRIKRLPLEVEQRVPLGRMATGYLCRIVGRISGKTLRMLADYEASHLEPDDQMQEEAQTEGSFS